MITVNDRKLCENCFMETDQEPCPFCSYDKSRRKRDITVLEMGSILDGRYMTGGVIGKGGFGITYLAYDIKLDKRVAVKEYYPRGIATRGEDRVTVSASDENSERTFRDGAERFYKEAELVSRFNGNPNIVNVYDFFRENDTVYFTMGFLKGETLKTYINTKGHITEGQAMSVYNCVTDALLITHSMNILHRDISPDNIMLCNDGTIKLIDFGAARQVLAEESHSLSVILKQGYAPLEQYQRKGKQGPWTDIYALGATIYTALTGEYLYDPMSRMEDDSEFQNNLHGISEGLWNVIKKSTMLQIKERYQDIIELKKDLTALKIKAEPFEDTGNSDIRLCDQSDVTELPPTDAETADPNETVLLGANSGGDDNATFLLGVSSGGDDNATELLGANSGGDDNSTVLPGAHSAEDDKATGLLTPGSSRNEDEALLMNSGESRGENETVLSGEKNLRDTDKTKAKRERTKKGKSPKRAVTIIVAAAAVIIVALIALRFRTGGKCGDDVSWKYKNGVMTFSGTGRIDKYPSTPYYAREVVVEDGITDVPQDFIHYDNSTFFRRIRGSRYSEITKVKLADSVNTIGSRSFSSPCIEEIDMPKEMEKINGGAFIQCEKLKSIDIPAGITIIGGVTFNDCYSLKDVNLPEGITIIDDGAFWNCRDLAQIDLPDTLSEIHEDSFRRCYALKEISIPAGVTVIEKGAFEDAGLEVIHYQGTVEQWKKIEGSYELQNTGNVRISFTAEPASDNTSEQTDDASESTASIKIINDIVNIYEEPDPVSHYDTLFSVEDLIYQADDMKNGMFRIRYADENNNFKYGWIENGDAEFID